MRINENQKVTLTLGQLKKLIKEANESDSNDVIRNFKEVTRELSNQGYVFVSSEASTRDTRMWHICYIGKKHVKNHREKIQSLLDTSGLSSNGFVLAKKEKTDPFEFPRMVKNSSYSDCTWTCMLSFPSEYAFDLRKFKHDDLNLATKRSRFPETYHDQERRYLSHLRWYK